VNHPGAPANKRVWPLFLVAALSFVPFLGILFGGVAATWGLISSRPRAIWAALIAMTGALLNMAAAVVITFRGAGKTDTAMDAKFTQQQMLRVVVAIEEYHAKEHAYPPSLQVLSRRMMLSRLVPTTDMSGTGFHLPREYHYVLAPDGESYDLVATGPDNVVGTADDIRPTLPDSIKTHSGFRSQAAGAHP
jgi:hypothetical protein